MKKLDQNKNNLAIRQLVGCSNYITISAGNLHLVLTHAFISTLQLKHPSLGVLWLQLLPVFQSFLQGLHVQEIRSFRLHQHLHLFLVDRVHLRDLGCPMGLLGLWLLWHPNVQELHLSLVGQ